jgi:hypothetical protein
MKWLSASLVGVWALTCAAVSPASAATCPDEKKPSVLCPDEKKPSVLCPDEKKPSALCPDEKKPSAS